MLRIESYVTPIILSYVDKYIKNLKPEDSKVSLWGGDAVFNNLDLRLDVLEQELNSPFTFISGHIHELCIHVPWTKLTSESIVITINTIECILKLKDADDESETSSQSGSVSGKWQDLRKKSRIQDFDVPASYVQGLMNRIINNVCIVCNNLILKYVEDDIVLSINAKTAEFRSVDNNWLPCFQDLTPEILILRNLVTLTDLTVCLDKRNASGKIDSYQEPLLYRCSFNCRIERKFSSAYSHQPTLTRCDCFCPQLHFSLSDSQLPMYLRLMQLLYALYYGQLPTNVQSDKSESPLAAEEGGAEDAKQHAGQRESWSSWAWDMGASLLPVYWEEEQNEDSTLHFRKDKILHFGIYIELVTWTFKLTEQSIDIHYSGPPKTRFVPFLTCQHQGSYFTVVLNSFEAVNVQCGISFVTIDPDGYCICGLDDSELRKMEEPAKIGRFVKCGESKNSYLKMSLFEADDHTDVESWNYHYKWDDHKITVTESSLLEKTPAFGADYIYILDTVRDEMDAELFIQIQSNLEYSNLKERSANRMIFGPSDVHFNSGFVHRLCAIKCALDAYEYAPYAMELQDVKSPDLSSPLEEEIAALEALSPLRTLSAVSLDCSVVLHFAQHPQVDVGATLASKNRKKSQRASCELSLSRVLPVPGILMKVSKCELQIERPFYPFRLVRTACRMRNPSEKMLKNSHIRYAVKVANVSFYLRSAAGLTVGLTGNLACDICRKTTLLPKWWMASAMTKDEVVFESERSSIWFSIPQIKLISSILTSWNEMMPNPELLHSNSLCHDAIDGSEKFVIMMVKLTGIDIRYCQTSVLWGVKALLSRFSLSLCQPNQEVLCMLASGPEKPTGVDDFLQNLSDFSEKLAKFSFQIPLDASNTSSNYLLTVATQKFSVIVDPIIFQWMKYSPKLFSLGVTNALAFRKISEVRVTPKVARKSIDSDSMKPDSSSRTLSETKTSGCFPFKMSDPQTNSWPLNGSWKSILVSVFPVASKLLISIDMQPVSVFAPVCPLKIASSSGITDAVYRTYLPKAGRSSCLGDALAINLPHVELKNSSQKVVLLENDEFPIVFAPDVVITDKDRLPWSLSLTQCHGYTLQNSGVDVRLPILKQSSASATLSLTPKFQDEVLTQIGLVIHIDMSPVDFQLSQRQAEVMVAVVNNFLRLITPSIDYKDPVPTPCPTGQNLPASCDKNTSVPAATSQSSFSAKVPPRHTVHKTSEGRKKDSSPASAQKLTESTSVKKAEVERISVEVETTPINVTTWIQWTLAKVSVSLFALENNRLRKLKAGLEDLTLSVDAQHIYCKVVAKVANINVKHYEKSSSGWSPGSYEGVILSTGNHFSPDLKVIKADTEDNSAGKAASIITAKTGDTAKPHGFLSVTMTVAQSTNVYGRWNQVVKKHLAEEWFVMENQKPSVLCEIDNHVSAFDLVLHFPVLESFAGVFKPLLGLHFSQETPQKARKTDFSKSFFVPEINSSSLPLVYFKSDTVRVFLPGGFSQSVDHDLLFAQIESVSIAPQVENPLPRSAIREDLYKAAELARILGVPGSNLEDRQYQVDLTGLSLSTGAWRDVSKVNNARPRSSSAELLGVRGENPALEWNNYDPNAQRVVSPIFVPLISRFNTRIILAPAIVYNNQDLKPILVAGHSVELNVTSDFHIYASLEQLLFLQAVFDEMKRSWNDLIGYRVLLMGPKRTEVLDSGVDCEVSSTEVTKADTSALFRIGEESAFESKDSCIDSIQDDFNDKFVPFDVLITGSKIVLDFYDKKIAHPLKVSTRSHHKSKLESKCRVKEKNVTLEAASTGSERSPSRTTANIFDPMEEPVHSSDKEAGYDGSEEDSICDGKLPFARQRLLPILHLAVSQPHVFISCYCDKQQFDLSYFDLRLKSVPVGHSIIDENGLPKPEDCFIMWLETRPGDPDPKTGVPPAFFTASAHNFLLDSGSFEVKIGRPVKVVISDTKLDQFRHLYLQLKRFIPERTSSKTKKAHKTGNKLEGYLTALNGEFFGMRHFSLSTSQILLTLEVNKAKKSELHFSLEGSEFTFSTVKKHGEKPPPEIVSDSICKDIQLKTSYRSLPLRSLVNPFTFRNKVRLVWTKWRANPCLKISSNLNILHACIGPENLFALTDCFKYFEHLLNFEYRSSKRSTMDGQKESPNVSFSDDLRAGMFQFVTQNEVPQPYQVAFNMNCGHMTWCYPEPRSLLKVEIYPVPFVSAVENQLENSVVCVLQYYDEMTDTFVNYKHFKLSESRLCHLDLPGANEKRLIVVSNIWRVCIDDEHYTSDCTVSPQALAACIRVDSLFAVSNLPNTKIAVSMSKIVINLVNHIALTGTKSLPPLRRYHLEPTFPDCQPFFFLSIMNSMIKALLWDSNQYADISGNCCAQLLNYKYLTLSCLLEIPSFLVSISVHDEEPKKKPGSIDVQARCNSVALNMSQSTFHTVVASEFCWRQAWQIVKNVHSGPQKYIRSKLPQVFLATYIICNDTLHSLVVSQVGTNEVILIKPGHYVSYAWRSQLSPPRLKISSREWRSKEDVSLDKCVMQVVAMQKSKGKGVCSSAVILSSEKLSPNQLIIKISGTVVIANNLDKELQVALLDRNHKDDWHTLCDGTAPPKCRLLSFIGLPVAIKVRYSAAHTPWSTEILINVEPPKDSFSVKLMPWKGKPQDANFVLCKVLRRRLSNSWRILVIFSPQFVVRSHLPRQMALILDNSNTKTKKNINIKGRGKLEAVNLDGSHHHQISFQLGPTLKESRPPITVTKAMLEQIRASEPKETDDIDTFLGTFSKAEEPKWPYVDPFYSTADFLFADQPKIDLQIGFSCLYPLCETVVMDVRPWALVINHTNFDIVLKEGNGNEEVDSKWYINPGAVFAPNKLENTFLIGVMDAETAMFSSPLQFHREDGWYSLNFEGKLPKNGSTNIKIELSSRICYLTVMSRFENSIQILHLVPTYSIANKSNITFDVQPLTVRGVNSNIGGKLKNVGSVMLNQCSDEELEDCPLLFWKVITSKDSSAEESMYLCLSSKTLKTTYIQLKHLERDCRIAFSTYHCSTSSPVANEAFLLTVHPHGSLVKFIIHVDHSPQMLIYNLTPLTLLVAQSSLDDDKSIEEENDLVAGFSSVPSGKKIYYSFPHFSSNFLNFSAAGSKQPKLHLSTGTNSTDATKEMKWSAGVVINQNYDHFVVVPNLGDVKVRTEKLGHTTYVFIDTASRVEISAKDIRSRILVTNKGLSISQDVQPPLEPAVPYVGLEICAAQSSRKKMHYYGTLVVQELSLSLQDDTTTETKVMEVIRATLDNFVVNFRPKIDSSDKPRSLNFSPRNLFEVVTFVENIQIDNQLYPSGKYDFNVILIGQKDVKLRSKILDTDSLLTVIQSMFNNSLFSCSVLLEVLASKCYMQSMNISCQPFMLFVEDCLIYSFYQYCKAFKLPVYPNWNVLQKDDDSLNSFGFKVPLSVVAQSIAVSKPILLKSLHIDAVSLLLSVHASAKMYLALDMTPLSFSPYTRQEVVTTGYALGYNMTMHYASSALFRAGWVVSSLNLIGNPGGFARTLGSGMKDFVQLPYEGILLGPWAFIAGITNGSLSLIKHLTAGTLLSVTNLANSVARNMERLAMDEEHLIRSETNRRLRREGLSGEVLLGLSAFGISILGAIGGIVHQPMQSLINDGLSTSNLVTGLGKGLVGVVAKPIGGAADLLMHTGQGLLKGAGWNNERISRSKPSSDHVSCLVNSDLKYLWKFALKGNLLCVIDATVIAVDSIMSPVTILIDSENIHIICTKSDRVAYELFDFLNVCLRPSQADPTLVFLEELEQKEILPDAESAPVCPERIAEYVRSACSEGVDIGNVSSDEGSTTETEDTSRKVKLALSPNLREYLVSVVELSSRRAKGLGFEC